MEESERLEKVLEGAKARVADLQADVKKYVENKSMLEGKILREAKNSLATMKELEGDLEMATKKLEQALPKVVEMQSLHASERYETLRTTYEKLKLDALSSFDSDFHTAAAQFGVLHLGLDLSGMDIDKIVVGGQLADSPDDEEEIGKELEEHVEVPFGLVSALQGEVATGQVHEPLAANDFVDDGTAGAGVRNA